MKGGGVQGLIADEEEEPEEEEEEDGEESVFQHEGKLYKRIKIEGEENDFLMDDDGNIYDMNFEFIGQAGVEDEEEEGGATGAE